MKVVKAYLDKSKRIIRIETSRGNFDYPIYNIDPKKVIASVRPDPDLGNEGVSILFDDGSEDSLHVDAFLEEAGDPDYFRNLALYKIGVLVDKLFDSNGSTQKEIAAKLKTSIPQVSRILNPTNYKKTIDQLVRVAAALGSEIEFSARPIGKHPSVNFLDKLEYLDEASKAESISPFNGLRLVSNA